MLRRSRDARSGYCEPRGRPRDGCRRYPPVVVALDFPIYVIFPDHQASIAEHVHDESHGLPYASTYLGMFGIGAVGASMAGVALTYSGPPIPFTVLSAIVAVAGGSSAYLVWRWD